MAWRTVSIALLTVAATGSQAHDLGGTRARLVQYDDRHLSLTLLVRLSDVLQRGSASPAQFRQKMLTMAAMPPRDFAGQIAKVEAALAAGTRIRLNGGREVAIRRWRWPSATVAQAQIRIIVMNAMSGGAVTEVHEEPFEADAEIASDTPITSAAMQFPPELGPVLLVAYRPTQVMIDKPGFAPAVRFAPPAQALKR